MNEVWRNEPDHKNFEEAGLQCRMLRGPVGAWCGYVGVPEGHPLHSKGYSDTIKPPISVIEREYDIDKIGAINLLCASAEDAADGLYEVVLCFDVHGGLTYADDAAPLSDPDGLWWFGFDCSHSGDLSPDALYQTAGDIYRDAKYVEVECRSLAQQLIAAQDWPYK